MSNTLLKFRTLKGISWSLIDNLAGSGVTFIIGLVLARLLSPSEFGVIGMVMVFIALSNVFVEGGLSRALIRKLDVSDNDYNTAFFSNIIISIIFVILLNLLAESISSFFNVAILSKILPFVSSLVLINGAAIVHKTILIRNVDFKSQAIVSLIASICSGIIGITLAVLGYGVWSLVWQQISRYFFNTLFLWVFNKWRPSLVFSIDSFKELFGFGSKVLLADLINSVYKNIFNVIIGKVYKAEQLGQYDNAERFNTILTNNLTSVVQRVSYPILSSVQANKENLTHVFRKFTIYSALVFFPLILGLAAMSKPLLVFLIGEKWLDASIYLKIMCVYGILYPFTNLNLNMLNVVGRSDKILKLEIIKKILFTPVFIVGIKVGMLEMLWAAVVYYYVEFVFNTWYSEKYFNYGLLKQVKDVIPFLLISLFAAVVMWFISLIPVSNIIILLLQISVGGLICFICFEKAQFPEYLQMKRILIDLIKNTINNKDK